MKMRAKKKWVILGAVCSVVLGTVWMALGEGVFAQEATGEVITDTKEPAAKNNSVQDKFGKPRAIETATDASSQPNPPDLGDVSDVLPQGNVGEGVSLNAAEVDIKELIKTISKATGKNFLLDPSIRGKVTIINESKMTFEEAYQAFLSALSVAGYTTVEGPANLIKVIPLKEAIQYPISIYKGSSPITDQYITRVITLNNISALDISNTVKTLVSKDGNLIAYPATNTLILTDTGTNIDRIIKIIRELDQEGPQQVIEMIPIQNATAKDITDKLNQLFDTANAAGKGKTTTATARRRTTTGDKAAGGETQEDVPSISRIIPDDRTNSIIVYGTKRAISDLKEVIVKLDTPLTGVEGTIHVYYLQNAVATELASVLSSLTSGSPAKSKASTKTTTGDKAAGSGDAEGVPSAEFEGGIKITADENTNSLVVISSPKDFETLVSKVIQPLDIPRRQVYLEAIVMELTSGKSSQWGIQAHGGAGVNVNDSTVTAFGSMFGGVLNPLAAGALGGLAGGMVSNTTVNIPVTDTDGTQSNFTIPALGLVINALQNSANANLLSTPSLLTLDNEEASILVGQNVAISTGTTTNETGTNTALSREDVGVELKITPQINESDTVRLKISQSVENILGLDKQNQPTFSKRAVDTVVVAENQQTIVIGGILEDNTTNSVQKIPLFGDIPLLGNLFKSKVKTRDKRNIVIFITPYIIRDRNDFMVILKRKIEERNQYIDYNYGKSDRKIIRENIRRHADHLLEFKEGENTPYRSPYTVNTLPVKTERVKQAELKQAQAEKAAFLNYSTATRGSSGAPVPSIRDREAFYEANLNAKETSSATTQTTSPRPTQSSDAKIEAASTPATKSVQSSPPASPPAEAPPPAAKTVAPTPVKPKPVTQPTVQSSPSPSSVPPPTQDGSIWSTE